MLQDFHHSAFCPAPFFFCVDDNLNPVPVKGSVCSVCRDEDILLLPLSCDKAKAPRMAGEDPCQGKSLRLSEFSFFGNADLSLRQQSVQHCFQLLPLLLGDVQQDGQLLKLHRNVRRLIHQGHQHGFSLFKQLSLTCFCLLGLRALLCCLQNAVGSAPAPVLLQLF